MLCGDIVCKHCVPDPVDNCPNHSPRGFMREEQRDWNREGHMAGKRERYA